MSSLKDKVAIVTGSNSGLGLAIATLFAEKGASVTLCGRDEVRLQSALVDVVKASGGHQERFLTVQGDLVQKGVRQKTIEKTVEKFGRLDILVANHGAATVRDDINVATEEDFDRIIDINLKSVFFLIQLAKSHLELTKGNIVIMSSVLSINPSDLFCMYPIAKAGLDHLARCLAFSCGSTGIRINNVNPSYIPSRAFREWGPDEIVVPVLLERERKDQPTGRCGKPEDVAKTVSFLMSDDATFITGETIHVDGGRRFTGFKASCNDM